MIKINFPTVLLMSVFSINLSLFAFSEPIKLELKNGLVWEGELGQHLQVDYVEKNKAEHASGELTRATDMYILIDREMIFINDIILIKVDENPKPLPQDSDGTSTENNTDTTSQKSSPANEVDSADFRWVIARGAGMSSDEAKNDAWRNAIEQVAGVLITARSQIENEQLVEDKITAHSNAYIVEFQLIDENIENGIVRVQINAKVAIKILFEHLSKDSDSLEFRNADGQSMYASIVTKKHRTQTAIETLDEAMRGYPESVFDIKVKPTRMVMDGVFSDGKEHLIVPVEFSYNTKGWNTFSSNLTTYLKHVSDDTDSFKLRLQGLRLLDSGYTRGSISPSVFAKNSWYKQGWERAHISGERDALPIVRFSFDEKLKGMFDFVSFHDQTVKSYQHDYIMDVVVIVDTNLKSGNSYAVTNKIWDSLLHRMKQVPAFYLNAISELDNSVVGEPHGCSLSDRYHSIPVSPSEFDYSTFRGRSDFIYTDSITSLPFATGMARGHTTNEEPESVTDLLDFDFSHDEPPPRVMIIYPYFTMFVNKYTFNARKPFLMSRYTYDYIIDIDLEEVKHLSHVEIDTYVLDLHNKKRRDNGEPTVPSPPSSDDNSGRGGIGGGGR